MSRKPILALVLMLSLVGATPALAFTAPQKNDQPIHVVADRLEVDNKAQVATSARIVQRG